MHPAISVKLRELVKEWRARATYFEQDERGDGEEEQLRARASELEAVLNNALASSFYGTGGESYTCSFCYAKSSGPCVNHECPIGYHNALTKSGMSSATAESQDPIALIRNRSFTVGDVLAWELIGPKLRDRAGREFAGGHDERARWFRDLAVDFEDEAKQKRAAHNLEGESGR